MALFFFERGKWMFNLMEWLCNHPDIELSCIYDSEGLLPFNTCVFTLRKVTNGHAQKVRFIFSAGDLNNPDNHSYLEVVLNDFVERLEREGAKDTDVGD